MDPLDQMMPPILGPDGLPLPPMGGLPPGGPGLPPPGLPPTMPGSMPSGMPPMDPMSLMGTPPIDPMMAAGNPATMGLPAGPPPPDPLTLPTFPEMPSLDLLPEEDELEPGPIYPSWQLKANGKNVLADRKPSKGYIQSAISADHLQAADLVQRILEDFRYYRMMHRSTFENLDQDEIEPFTVLDVPIVMNKIANMIHGIDETFEWYYHDAQTQTGSQLLEDFAHWWMEQVTVQHTYGGNTSLKWDWAWNFCMYGRIVSRVLPDLTDPEFPWSYQLLDPATVFPTFGGKQGLLRASLVYNQTADVMLQEFGDNKKFVKHYTNKHGEDKGYPDLNYVGEVREYIDQWNRYVEFDGIEALPITAHELGYVPIVYTLGPGESGNASSPYRAGTLTGREILAGYASGATSNNQDMAAKGVCFFHTMKPAIRQLEAVMSLAMTTAKQRINPPMAIESPYDDNPKPIDMRSGQTTKLRTGEKAIPLLNGVTPGDLQILIGKLKEDLDRSGLPNNLFGTVDGSNISGFAANSMSAAAKDQTLPVITGVANHMMGVIDMATRQYRDMCYVVTDNAMPVQTYGRSKGITAKSSAEQPSMDMMMQVMGQMGMDPMGIGATFDAHKAGDAMPDRQAEPRVLTRELIVQMGSRPKVMLESVALQDKTMLANYATMMVKEKMMSRFRAMSEVGVKNPEIEWEQILSEDAETNPKMLELVKFPEMLWKNGDKATFAAYFAAVVLPQMMEMMMGGQQPGQPPGGGGGGPPGIMGPETVQGSSQPGVGQGPGPGSGPGNGAPDPMAGGGIEG